MAEGDTHLSVEDYLFLAYTSLIPPGVAKSKLQKSSPGHRYPKALTDYISAQEFIYTKCRHFFFVAIIHSVESLLKAFMSDRIKHSI